MTRKQVEALSQLVMVVAQKGPRNIPDIASELQIPIETARHRLKKQVLDRGITIHTGIDFGKLGLKRSWTFLDFNDEYRGREAKVAKALSDVAYLTYFTRTMPEERFLAQFAVPNSKLAEHKKFLEAMTSSGILNSYEVNNLLWTRHLSMNPEYYNFKKRVWDIDWNALDNLRQAPIIPKISDAVELDKKDLLILKELQLDSSVQFADIADKLRIDVKTLLYHYHTHIEARDLVTKYLVRWRGDPKNVRRYAVLPAKVLIRNVSQQEMLRVQGVFARLPFVWSDSYGDNGFYLADLVIPLTHYADVLSFLQRNLGALKRRVEVAIVDQQCTSAFSLPCQMYDENLGWTFEQNMALERFTVLASETLKNKAGM